MPIESTQLRTAGGFKGDALGSRITRSPCLFALGLLFNQTSVLFGMNISAADLLAVGVLLAAAFRREISVPFTPLIFFLIVSFSGIMTAMILSDTLVPGAYSTNDLFLACLKLTTSFAYFLIGFNLVRSGRAKAVVEGFVIGAVLASSLAVVAAVIPSLRESEILVYGGFRFRGFMNDPNYFAIISIAAMAVLWTFSELKSTFRWVGSIILTFGTLMSGSKTGALVFIAVVLWKIAAHLRERLPSRSVTAIVVAAFLTSGVLFTLLIGIERMQSWIIGVTAPIPALNRISTLFSSPEAGFSDDGSGRQFVWDSAIEVISHHPATGVGLGTYNYIAEYYGGSIALAHNTFLQLAAEWGLPLAICFFSWVIFQLLTSMKGSSVDVSRSNSAIVIVFLMGSLAISLNNARIFWLALGVVLASNLAAKHASRTSSLRSTQPPAESSVTGIGNA